MRYKLKGTINAKRVDSKIIVPNIRGAMIAFPGDYVATIGGYTFVLCGDCVESRLQEVGDDRPRDVQKNGESEA